MTVLTAITHFYRGGNLPAQPKIHDLRSKKRWPLMHHCERQIIINTTLPHYHQSLSPKTKVSLHAKSWNQCISITERNWCPSDLCGWVMRNLSQVSPHGLDKIKDENPENFVLISSNKNAAEEWKCEWNLKHKINHLIFVRKKTIL